MATKTKRIFRLAARGQRTRRPASQWTIVENRKKCSKRRLGLLVQVAAALNPDALKQVTDNLEKDLRRLGHLEQMKPAKGLLLQAIHEELEPEGFPERPAEQNRILQDALEESFRQRQVLLADVMTAPQVASLLHTSRQTPLNRAVKGTLLAIYENGKWLFPCWQFDTYGVDGVLSGLPQILRVLTVSPLEKLNWFVRRSPYLEDRTPLEVLKSGDVERLVSLARSVGQQ